LFCLNFGSEGKPILAGTIFALSFFTKQSVLFLIFPLAAITFFLQRRQTIIFMLVFGVITTIGILLLNILSNGWYQYYIFTLPSNHPLNTSPDYLYYLITTILSPIILSFGVGIAAILIKPREYFQNKSYLFFLIAALIGLASSILSGSNPGSTHNAYIPAYAILAIFFGIGLTWLEKNIVLIHSINISTILNILLFATIIFQFWILNYKTRDFVPSEYDVKRGKALLKYIADTPGDILIPSHSYLALYANKKPYYHDAPLWELNGALGEQVSSEWKPIKTEIKNYAQSGQVSFVFLEQPLHTWYGLTCAKEAVFKSASKFVPSFYKMVCY